MSWSMGLATTTFAASRGPEHDGYGFAPSACQRRGRFLGSCCPSDLRPAFSATARDLVVSLHWRAPNTRLESSRHRDRQSGADIAVEWLIGAPAGMSLNPENSSTGWPSFGERFKINPGLYSSLDERRGSGQPAHSPSPESQHEIAAHGTWIGGTCQMRLRFRG